MRCRQCGARIDPASAVVTVDGAESPNPSTDEAGEPQPPPAVDFGPIAAARPSTVPDEDAFAIRLTVPETKATTIARRAILEGFFRPGDIDSAELSRIRPVRVPLWLVDASIDGFHVGLQTTSNRRGRTTGVVPTGGYRTRSARIHILARRLLAIDPSAKVKLENEDLVPLLSELTGNDVEIVAPDMTQEEAEAEAKKVLERRIQPSQALYASFEYHVKSAALVYCPLWVIRYRYQGEASRDLSPDQCHVAVSAHTGKIVSAHHPSAFRAALGKVKKLLPIS